MAGHMMLFKAAMARKGRKIELARDWPSASTMRQRADDEPRNSAESAVAEDSLPRRISGSNASRIKKERR